MTIPDASAARNTGAAPQPRPTVFVVDDDGDVLRAMTRLLRSAGYTVEVFGSGDDFLTRVMRPVAGCVVLDYKMPLQNGLEIQAELNRRSVTLPVVFVTGHGDIPVAVQALKRGAFDFLTKPYRAEVLLNVVAAACENDIRQRAALEERDEILRRHAALTPRERQVLVLIVRGLLNKQIAGALGNSERTVKVHRARVMDKMRARSVAELARMVERSGLAAEAAPET